MQIVCMILCGLALLAAIFDLILLRKEKKRNEKRNAAMVQLYQKEHDTLDKQIWAVRDVLVERLDKLEAGVMPDYEAARQAAEAVDEFNQGLSNILGFDPMEAARKSRQSTGGDG